MTGVRNAGSRCLTGSLAAIALTFGMGFGSTRAQGAPELAAVGVGPVTPYGETPEEAANKRVVFEWNYLTMVKHQPQEAYARFVSPSYCDHGHMETMGKRPCASFKENLDSYVRRHPPGRVAPDEGEIPHLASVDGEMVTMYGKGVDIFRVHDGKITDHWDASPPAAVSIPAHAPGFPAWAMGDRHGPPPMLPEPH